MTNELQIFSSDDFEPFAVFYFGEDGYGLTKEKAIEAYEERYRIDYDYDLKELATEPKLFYLREEGEWGEDNEYPWYECDKDHPDAVACFGVLFE
jgi:hypothetical protein